MDSSYISFSGVKAAESMINSASENISNLNTHGYKVKTTQFSSLVGSPDSLDSQGVRVSSSGYDFSSGKIIATDNNMDVAVDGSAFIEVVDRSGNSYLSRGGRMTVSDEGYLQLQEGYFLSGMILMPDDATSLSVSKQGEITAKTRNDQDINLGVIDMVKPINVTGLEKKAGGVFAAGSNAGDIIRVTDGSSKIMQKSVELSNVDLTEELVQLMLAQNMYKANSNVININSTVSQWLSDLLQV